MNRLKLMNQMGEAVIVLTPGQSNSITGGAYPEPDPVG